MSRVSAPPSAAPYLYCCWRPRRSAGSSLFPMFSLSPFFPSVSSCSFLRVASYFALFFLVSPFVLLLPFAVATAADGRAQCRDPPADGTIVPSCSLSSRKSFGSLTSASLSPVLCEDEVNGLPEYYAVVMDSGSTGTRAFVYKVRVEPGSCGEIQQSSRDKEEERTGEGVGLENGEEAEATGGLFHPLGRAIVQVPAIATRRIGPGITLFAKRETGRKEAFDDLVEIENMTEESMRRELLEDERLVLESEQAEEEKRRAQKRLTSRKGKEGGGGRAAAAAAVTAKSETAAGAAIAADDAGASERYGRQEDVEESLEKYLGELRDFVLTVVPAAARKEKRAFVFFRGTAGMRTLSQEQQHKLLDRVRASLSTWGLQLPSGAAGASVLSGAEEGVLGWVALNQLLGNFPRRDALLNFAAGHHHLCSLRKQQQQEQHQEHEQQQQPLERQQQQEGEEERGEESQKLAVATKENVGGGGEGRVSSTNRRRNSSEDDQGTDDDSLSASSAFVARRAGLVEMGGASAQVVLQLPAEARAANLLKNPYLENPSSFSPPSFSSSGNDGTSATRAEEDGAEQEQQQQGGRGEEQRQQQRRQQRHQRNKAKTSTVRTVEPSERIFESRETRLYPPVRRHRGPYVAEDFFEVDLCRSRHIVYSKSFLGLGRQHALMQHIHDSVSEAMEKRRREIEEGEGPLPTAGNPVEATVPCLPADVRVHVNASSAATAAFDEDFSKIVQEEQRDIEEHAAAAAAAEEAHMSQQRRQHRGRRNKRGSINSSSNSGRRGTAVEEQEGDQEQGTEQLMNGKKKSSTPLFAAAGAASPTEKTDRYEDSDTGTRAETEDEEEQADGKDVDEEEEKEGGEEEEEIEKDGKQAKWKKLPRPGVAKSFQRGDGLQLLLKKNEANVLQQIESVAAQGTSDGTACMHKMAQTMMRVGRVPFEIHRDMQLYATENFYHFNEYVLQANGKPDFTVDLFSREGRKLCFLQQVKEVHRHLHPGAAREKAQTACFGLMFMSEFLRRVVGLERNRVLRAVNDLHDVEVSWTAAVPMLYMPHVLAHAEATKKGEEATAAAAGASAAAAPVETESVPAGVSTERAFAEEEEDEAEATAHAIEKEKEAAGKAAEVAVEKGGVKLQRQRHHAQRGVQGGREEATPRTSFLAESLKTSHDEL